MAAEASCRALMGEVLEQIEPLAVLEIERYAGGQNPVVAARQLAEATFKAPNAIADEPSSVADAERVATSEARVLAATSHMLGLDAEAFGGGDEVSAEDARSPTPTRMRALRHST